MTCDEWQETWSHYVLRASITSALAVFVKTIDLCCSYERTLGRYPCGGLLIRLNFYTRGERACDWLTANTAPSRAPWRDSQWNPYLSRTLGQPWLELIIGPHLGLLGASPGKQATAAFCTVGPNIGLGSEAEVSPPPQLSLDSNGTLEWPAVLYVTVLEV